MSAERKLARRAALFCVAAATLLPALSHAQGAGDSWEWRATIYGWLPSISGSTTFPTGGSGPSISADAGDILSSLKMAFMGALEARKGQWGVFTDVVYADLGGSKSGLRELTVGGGSLPADVSANVSLDIKTWAWTVAGTYTLTSTPQNATSLLFGARMLTMEQTLDYSFNGNIAGIGLPGRSGRAMVDGTNWDAVVGLKGVATLSTDRRWVMPYYVDVGTGQSKFTWQGMVGVGYTFDWGTTILAWRYLDYEMKSGALIENISLNGPLIGVSFRW